VGAAQHAFSHGATVALAAGSVLLLLTGLAAALLHRLAPRRTEAVMADPASQYT